MKSLMGIETEYGFTALDAAGRRLTVQRTSCSKQCATGSAPQRRRRNIPVERCTLLPRSGQTGILHAGMHRPVEVVRYVRAGERMLESTVAALTP